MVEQWPFKPFVTGSNPVRPIINMFKKLLFVIYFIPLFSFSQTVSINDELENKLNANYINNDSSKIIVLILHGTRGHKKLELIQTLSERFSDSNIDTLSMNLSYGITNRNDDFLPCDIIHDHLNSKSLSEIRLWFDFIKQKNKYEKIILLGHSRGGLNIAQFYSSLPDDNKDIISNVIMLAPISDEYSDTIEKINNNTLIQKIKNNSIENDEVIKINFMSCNNAEVKYATYKDYTHITNTDTGNRGSLIGLLNSFSIKTLIITASDDDITPNTYERVSLINNKHINVVQIDDADHFFRDLYFDDMFDAILEFIQ